MQITNVSGKLSNPSFPKNSFFSKISLEVTKANDNLFVEPISFHLNKSLKTGKFPNCLKLANIILAFKKDPRTSKNNYRPVNILCFFPKIFERLLSIQFSDLFEV